MPDASAEIQKIFERRMTLVSQISALNADQLKNTQKLSGNQIDVQRYEESTRQDDGSQRQELADAKARNERLLNRISDCDERLRALEQEVAELDRKLETL